MVRMVFLNIILKKENIQRGFVSLYNCRKFPYGKKKFYRNTHNKVKGQLPQIVAANMINRGLGTWLSV